MNKSFHVITLFFLMIITGVFWGTWFTLTRSIESFSNSEFLHIGQVIIENVALPMRFILPSGIIFMVISLLLFRDKKSFYFYCGIFSFILLIAVLLITLIVLVPIDNNIRTWQALTVPSDFDVIRTRWKNFHELRTFLSLASFLLFSASAIYDASVSRNKKMYHP